jgi:hypothetical protein
MVSYEQPTMRLASGGVNKQYLSTGESPFGALVIPLLGALSGRGFILR